MLAGAAAVGAEAPKRVVSMNLCTDQLALMLAAPGQLVSVTRVSLDPLSSPMIEAARGLPVNNGRAEEIYAMAPDLVLAGQYSDPLAVDMLRGLGIKVIQFPIATSMDDIAPAVRAVGEALGREEVAEKLADNIEVRLAELPSVGEDAPIAAFFYPNGYSLGAGTFSDDLISRAGFRNLSVMLGLAGGGRLSLEEVLMHRPDVLITGTPYAGASRSEEIMGHAALTGIPRAVSGPEWVCGTPMALEALDDMIALRERLLR